MLDARDPIAVFDSGVGGISVLKELLRKMPNESYIYLGDSANAPYGVKTVEEVRALSFRHVEYFVERSAKAVVIACNTATAVAAKALRDAFPGLPIIGMEPALKPAVAVCKHARVAVMATPITLEQKKFRDLRERFEPYADIFDLPCPGLVDLIEQGHIDDRTIDAYLAQLFAGQPLDELDSIVLGCTHYSHIRRAVERLGKGRIQVLDGNAGTAQETYRRLLDKNLLNTDMDSGCVEIINTLKTEETMALCRKLLYAE